MPPVKNVGEPCAGEPHARFDGRELETEQTVTMVVKKNRRWETSGDCGFTTYRHKTPPAQSPTLPSIKVAVRVDLC